MNNKKQKPIASKIRLCVALALSLTTILKADVILPDGTINTSLIRLLAHPEKFNGKRVHVLGFYVLRLELSGLFVSREAAEIGNIQDAVWIDLKPKAQPPVLRTGYADVI